jgi:hypothetical protein
MTLRDVHRASMRLAARYRSRRFVLSPGRLSMIETKDEVPSIFRLYALSKIYRRGIKDLLTIYGLSELDVSKPKAGRDSGQRQRNLARSRRNYRSASVIT